MKKDERATVSQSIASRVDGDQALRKAHKFRADNASKFYQHAPFVKLPPSAPHHVQMVCPARLHSPLPQLRAAHKS
ncbi:hypothetical protein EBQ26_08985 [Allofranklinella schreckenbergeri]|uniref:Uncharacterized protein n=1 Tax=Allofranklinella schreckenbergeri TaxID=1076744 RepID=A0A3M6PYE7_9BURK|nr:hypothetical protein [Allofranklinella schreckenbergeri]RMW96073.1 hypothetical protein EBQ25_11400 [Allofranklinella schreckenbergeri]RMW96942.1 hypothetical protein EBQ26_08985 [Allofranklinella schreckenbergeri]RMX09165.1 hypothetical protein EBQ24_07455 [Allofranklinella schreckenbergeri]RRD40154.1 hypothetical protein EII18_11640 [Comamonadaceae bacterium OH3737_COT-264]